MHRILKIEIKSLINRDYGAIIVRALSYCLFICGLLLFIQKDIADSLIFNGLKALILITSAALFLCFFYNARSKFRPGWTLPTAAMYAMIGSLYLLAMIFPTLGIRTFGATTLVLILSAVNSSLLLSSAVQTKALALRRWPVYLFLFILNIVYGILLFFNIFNLRQMPVSATAIYLLLFALQCFIEGLYK